jgi:hypothetical protein
MTDFTKVLMERDGMTEEEAENERKELFERAMTGECIEEMLLEHGLESDYVFDVLV